MVRKIKSIFLLFVILAALAFSSCAQPERLLSASELLNIGERYLIELNYEQALVHFTMLIEVEPMNVRAYIGAAEALIALRRHNEAVTILRQGYEQTGNAEIAALLENLEERHLNENVEESGHLQQPDESPQSEQANERNLTGQTPLTADEFENAGIGVPLRNLIGMYGVTQGTVDLFAIRVADWVGDFQLEWDGVGGGLGVPAPTASIVASFDSEAIVRDISINDPERHQATLMRWTLGMSMLEAIQMIEINNPAIIAAASDPSPDIFAELGTAHPFAAVITDSNVHLMHSAEFDNYTLSKHLRSAGGTFGANITFDNNGFANHIALTLFTE